MKTKIYKKSEEGLNFMNLLISGFGSIYLVYVTYRFLWTLPFLILMLISFYLNVKEFRRFSNERRKQTGEGK